MFRTLKTELCAKSGSTAKITFRKIANRLLLPVKAFDPRSRLFPQYRFSSPSSQMFTDKAFCSWMWRKIHELYRQSNSDHSLTHSLTHSILINLFIKFIELSNFLLPPVLSIVFVQECSVVLRKVWRGETKKAYIFVESLGKSLSSASKIEAGHHGFHVVLFRKYVVFFWLSAFAHT